MKFYFAFTLMGILLMRDMLNPFFLKIDLILLALLALIAYSSRNEKTNKDYQIDIINKALTPKNSEQIDDLQIDRSKETNSYWNKK